MEAAIFRSARFFGITAIMSEQQTSIARKRRGPLPTGQGTQVQVRMLPDLLGALDRWIEAQPDPKPSRPEAARRLIRKALEE